MKTGKKQTHRTPPADQGTTETPKRVHPMPHAGPVDPHHAEVKRILDRRRGSAAFFHNRVPAFSGKGRRTKG